MRGPQGSFWGAFREEGWIRPLVRPHQPAEQAWDAAAA